MGTRLVLLLSILPTAALAACTSSSIPASPLYVQAQFQVGGMQHGPAGGTWMGWPDAISKALLELPGVQAVVWDLAEQRVSISYLPQKVTPAVLKRTIEQAENGFEATLVPTISTLALPQGHH